MPWLGPTDNKYFLSVDLILSPVFEILGYLINHVTIP